MLYELPDDLLLGCVDGSMRICVKLASTNKILCDTLQLAAAANGLRLVVVNVKQACRVKKQLHSSFYISELVLTGRAWPFIDWTVLLSLTCTLTSCTRLV